MTEKNIEKERILSFCSEKFLKEGFHKTTMDEIARNLKISKKTIYKYYSSKNKLVDEITAGVLNSVASEYKKITNNKDENAVIKLINISRFILKRLMTINAVFFDDLKQKHPERWNEVIKTRRKIIQKNMGGIMEQGQKEDLIIARPIPLMLKIMTSAIDGSINPEFLMNNDISAKKAGETTIEIIFNGILTKKGKKIFSQIKPG
ncbi:MAG: TetR/AcrR family transcriptional regulator [Melioribacteraceae bacterium]|nr:TetR/AcrR family transcriptional regulator [Melioribacteraceae bacterium]